MILKRISIITALLCSLSSALHLKMSKFSKQRCKVRVTAAVSFGIVVKQVAWADDC